MNTARLGQPIRRSATLQRRVCALKPLLRRSNGGLAALGEIQRVRPVKEASVFIDSVIPIRLGTWDFRYFIAKFGEENLIQSIREQFQGAPVQGFRILSIEPRTKDGGLLMRFQYAIVDPKTSTSSDATAKASALLSEIEEELRVHAQKEGGIPTWLGAKRGTIWMVKGSPWLEDMMRYPSSILKIEFEGPDVHPEALYNALRPYGRINEITRPQPVPIGVPRSSQVNFRRIRSAVNAHNCVHGLMVSPVEGAPPSQQTRLAVLYERPIKAHVINDWVTSHPRIVLPIVFFLLGTLTYTIFDPIRVFSVEGKMLEWFDVKNFKLVKWLRKNTLDRLSFTHGTPEHESGGVWKERKDAEVALKAYLSEYPSTIAFMHGPQGSGKSNMIGHLLSRSNRRYLIIDCEQIYKAGSDSGMVSELARQTGYWPQFSFLASMNSLIDLASVGLIGQKAGFSSPLDAQLKQVLEVVATALGQVSTHHIKERQLEARRAQLLALHSDEERLKMIRIQNGTYHDGRIDCIAGSGVMCELGIGDESLSDWEDLTPPRIVEEFALPHLEGVLPAKLPKASENEEEIEALPIVIIKNYGVKSEKREVLDVLADWAAGLAENRAAHVIVVSDNRENMKRLAKALPTRPLASIALMDADAESALAFVKSKLLLAGVTEELQSEELEQIKRLGGRAGDLEVLVYKVRSGQTIGQGVEDIISRGVGEMRKTAFGDDSEDAKNLPWTRQHAWSILKRLAKTEELQYTATLLDFPFGGDEAPLRALEQAELISINTHDGVPATIRPGKPVDRYVFQRLVNDRIFQSTQDIALNEKAIASAENTVRQCEEELVTLKKIEGLKQSNMFWSGNRAKEQRARYLEAKMLTAQLKQEDLEKQNVELKKVLAKGRQTPSKSLS